MSAVLRDISEKLQKGKMNEVAALVKQAIAEGRYKIDPEKEHERQKNEEEQGATAEEYKRDGKEHDEEETPLHVGLLDIKA